MHARLLLVAVALTTTGVASFACAPPRPPRHPITEAPAASKPVAHSPTRSPQLAPTAEPPTLPQVEHPTCRIDRAHPDANIDLAWRGGTFAGLASIEAIAFRAGKTDATAVVETSDLLLVGEVDLHRVLVAPTQRGLLVDGYLELRRARITRLDGDRAVLAPLVPAGVHPTEEPAFELPCGSLRLGSTEARPPTGKAITLRPGLRVDLATTPGGTAVATLHTPEAAPLGDQATERRPALADVRLLERRGAFARIVVREPWTGAVGWITTSALATSPAITIDKAGSAAAPSQPSLRCPAVVTVYLRYGDDVVIAGRFKPRAPIRRSGQDAAGELGVALPQVTSSLGDERRGDEREPPGVFVRRDDLAGCRLEP